MPEPTYPKTPSSTLSDEIDICAVPDINRAEDPADVTAGDIIAGALNESTLTSSEVAPTTKDAPKITAAVEEQPMREVHVPHEAIHTWKSFFIHIATIVIGLLIAVALEQAVERIHQHYELEHTLQALQREAEANRSDILIDARQWRREMAELENNLIVLSYLKQHPGALQSDLPGVLMWEQAPFLAESEVWQGAERDGMTRLMSPDESNRYRALYSFLAIIRGQELDDWNAYNDAARYSVVDGDPTHLSPADLDSTFHALEFTMEKHIQVGDSLAFSHDHFPELASPITFHEIDVVQHQPQLEDPETLRAAYQLTQDRMNAANKP